MGNRYLSAPMASGGARPQSSQGTSTNRYLAAPLADERSAFENVARGVGSGFTTGFQSAAEGALWVGDALLPGQPLEGLRDGVQDAKARTREFFDPEGTAGLVGEIGGAIVSEGAQSVLGGVGIGNALMKLGRGTSIAARAARPVASAIEAGRQGSFGQRVVANTAPFAPIDALIGAGAADPEGDVSWVPGSGRVEGAIFGAGAGLVGAGVIEGGISAARRLRPRPDLTAQADEALQRAAAEADQQVPPTEPEVGRTPLLAAGEPIARPMPGAIPPEQVVRTGERGMMVERAERAAVEARLSELTRRHPAEVLALDDAGLDQLRAEILEQVRHPRQAAPSLIERRVASMSEPIADQESVRRSLIGRDHPPIDSIDDEVARVTAQIPEAPPPTPAIGRPAAAEATAPPLGRVEAVAPPAIPREPVAVRKAFRKATDDDLVRQLSDSIDRLEKESNNQRGDWYRENEYGQVISGGRFSDGRAKVQAKYAQKRIAEIEEELRKRGYSDDDIENALLTYQERRAEIEGQEQLDRYFDQASAMGFRTESAGEIGGALVGGVFGSQVASEGREGEGFLTGAAAGAGLGYLARRMEAARVRPKSTAGMTPETRQVLASVSEAQKTAPRTDLTALANRLYRQVVDTTYPLKRFLKGAGEGVAEVVRATGWKGAAESRVRTDLAKVMDMARGYEPQVVALATARRALELEGQGLANKGVDLVAAARAERVLSAIPEVRQAADALRDYYRSLLDAKLAEGVISADDYANLVAKGRYYVPFVRDFADEVMRSGGQGLVQRTKTIRRMTEEDAVSKIRNPFEQAVIDTYIAERAIARQRVTNVVAAAYDNNPAFARSYLKEIAANDKAGARRVEVNLAGKRRVFDVTDEELYESWSSMAPVAEDIMVSALGRAKNLQQAGVTHFPAFGVANAARDLTMTAVQYPVSKRSYAAGAVGGAAVGAATNDDPLAGALIGAGLGGAGGIFAPHIARTVRALGDIIAAKSVGAPPAVRQGLEKLGDGKLYEEWLREGGSGFGFFARTPLDAQRMTRELIERGEIHPSRILNPKSVWDALAQVNKAVEEAPRLARYRHARAAGQSKAESIAESRDISLDFSRHGSGTAMRFLSGSVAFLNPKVQGWDKLVRMLKNPKTALVAGLTITAPSVALWFLNKDNPEYWNTSQTTRNLFWLIPDGDDGFYYIPKPFELGYIFGSAPERLLDFMQHRNPELLRFAGKEMLANAVGGLPIPTAVLPTMETNIGEGGYEFFRDRPVVPENLQGLPSEMQQDERTSFVGSAVGSALGIAPKKIDHVIRGQTGSVGGYLNDRLTDVAQATGLDKRERPAYDRPGLMARFRSREDAQPEPVTALYRRMNALEKVARGFDVAAQAGAETLARYQERHGAELNEYYNAVGLFEAMKELQATRRLIQTDTSLSAEDRRAQLLTIREEMAALASEALKIQQR